MGELTDVASAKRAVLGVFNESPEDELEEVLVLTRIRGSFSSSTIGCLSSLSRFWCCLFDMLSRLLSLIDRPVDVTPQHKKSIFSSTSPVKSSFKQVCRKDGSKGTVKERKRAGSARCQNESRRASYYVEAPAMSGDRQGQIDGTCKTVSQCHSVTNEMDGMGEMEAEYLGGREACKACRWNPAGGAAR